VLHKDPVAVGLEYVGESPAGLQLVRDPAAPQPIRLVPEGEIADEPDPKPLVAGVLFQNGFAAIIGAFATFNTFIALSLAVCVALGLDWFDRPVQRGAVIYVYSEGRAGIKKRIAAIKAWLRYTGAVDGLYFVPHSLLLSDPGQLAALIVAICALPTMPALVIIDTLARSMHGNENDVQDMGAFIRGCDVIRERTNAAVLVVHHPGHTADRARGSSSFEAALDTEILVKREEGSSVVTLSCRKQKDAAEFHPFALEAFQVAGSMVMTPVVPGGPKLTPNDVVALSVEQLAAGMTYGDWLRVSGLAKGSLNNSRSHLLELAYVRIDKGSYIRTDAGSLALRTKEQEQNNA
jgi:hypothetical protein